MLVKEYGAISDSVLNPIKVGGFIVIDMLFYWLYFDVYKKRGATRHFTNSVSKCVLKCVYSRETDTKRELVKKRGAINESP